MSEYFNSLIMSILRMHFKNCITISIQKEIIFNFYIN